MPIILNTMTATTHNEAFNADQLTVNDMEDSYHFIAVEDPNKLNDILNIFFKDIITCFTINKLVINKDKTSLLIHAHPRNQHITKDITIENPENDEDVCTSIRLYQDSWLSHKQTRLFGEYVDR